MPMADGPLAQVHRCVLFYIGELYNVSVGNAEYADIRMEVCPHERMVPLSGRVTAPRFGSTCGTLGGVLLWRLGLYPSLAPT